MYKEPFYKAPLQCFRKIFRVDLEMFTAGLRMLDQTLGVLFLMFFCLKYENNNLLSNNTNLALLQRWTKLEKLDKSHTF